MSSSNFPPAPPCPVQGIKQSFHHQGLVAPPSVLPGVKQKRKRKPIAAYVTSFVLVAGLLAASPFVAGMQEDTANAKSRAVHTMSHVSPHVPSQTLTVASDTKTASVVRDGYVAVEGPQIAWAGLGLEEAGTFSNNSDAAVQYPFGVGVKITDEYGPRESVCVENFGCSKGFHSGIDFDTPEGVPIQVIAEGVVVEMDNSGGLGTHIVIEHQIDGQTVQSIYGHMLLGSVEFKVGQAVRVGDPLGKVGSTGLSTGPHLHFELVVDGEHVNPMLWDKWNTGIKKPIKHSF